jgi:hypothetical protein
MVALVEEGPFGDPSALETRPDDPLVKEWKDKVALRDIVVKVDGLTEDEAIPFNGPFLDQVRAGLTREQEAQASTQAGHRPPA